MRKILIIALLMVAFCGTAFAEKTTYIATNHRFNSVRLAEVKGGVAEARQMTHPTKVDPNGLKAALMSIKLARTFLIKKEVDTQDIFNDAAASFLATNMATAFEQAKANEEVQFSYLVKEPLIILRNDRLTIGYAWIHERELHIKFTKLYAQISMDVDKRGNEVKAAGRARGLRVQLEIQPGQKLGLDDPEEIVLDLDYNYVVNPEDKKPKEGTTMSGKKVPFVPTEAPATQPAADAAAEVSKESKVGKSGKKPEVKAAEVAPAPKTVQQRLEELDQLKKQKLIDSKEYKEKKAEILKDL